jgi:hypothetical protein
VVKIKRFAINTGNEAFDDLLMTVYTIGESKSIIKGMLIGIVSTILDFILGALEIFILIRTFC